MTVLRYIGGFLLTLVLLPVMGIAWLGCVAYYGLKGLMAAFKELWFSISDPAYVPNIGYGGVMKRRNECRLASEAVAKGDWASAVMHWKAAGRLYDAPSMLKLGECFEASRGVAASCGAAYEYYTLAARYGMSEAKEACQRLEEFRLPSGERRQFVRTMWI